MPATRTAASATLRKTHDKSEATATQSDVRRLLSDQRQQTAETGRFPRTGAFLRAPPRTVEVERVVVVRV